METTTSTIGTESVETTTTPIEQSVSNTEAAEGEKPISMTEAKAIGHAAVATAEASKSQVDIIENYLPDGTLFRGTPKEYNEAVRDYFDNLGR